MNQSYTVPLASYQRSRLTHHIWALWQTGDLTPHHVNHARVLWGATHTEAGEVLDELGVDFNATSR